MAARRGFELGGEEVVFLLSIKPLLFFFLLFLKEYVFFKRYSSYLK